MPSLSSKLSSLHRVGDPPDDARGQRPRRHQPVARGFRTSTRRRRSPRRCERPRRPGPTSTRSPGERPAFRAALARQAEPLHGRPGRPETERRRHLRGHRGDDGRPADGLRSGRQGRRVLAVLRELRRRHDPLRRGADLRAPSIPVVRVRARELEAAFAQQARRPSSSATRRNPTGKVFTRAELETIAAPRARSTTPSSSPTRCTSTSSIRPRVTCISRRCRACSSARCRAARSRRRIRSPAGGSGTSSPRARSSTQARKVHDFLTVGAPAPLQEAAVTALLFPDSYYDELIVAYTERRKVFLDALDRAGLPLFAPRGSVLRPRRRIALRRHRRRRVLRMDGPRSRRRRRPRFELLPRTHAPPRALPLRQAPGNPPRRRRPPRTPRRPGPQTLAEAHGKPVSLLLGGFGGSGTAPPG